MPITTPRFRTGIVVLTLALAVTIGPTWADENTPDNSPRLAAHDVELADHFEGASSRDVYEAIADQAGLSVTFAPELRDRTVSIDLHGTPPTKALRQVSTLARHFVAPMGEKTFLVVEDTPQNRRTFEPIGIRSFSLRYAQPKDVMTALRTLIDVNKITASEDPPRITIRDTYPRLDAATRIVEMLDREPWEIRLDVELLPIAAEHVTGISKAGGEISVERAEALRRGAGGPTATGVLGLVGTRETRWKVFGKDDSTGTGSSKSAGDEDRLVSLVVRSRLSADDPRLGLEIDLTVLSPGGSRTNSLRQTSTFRISEETVLALPVLLRDETSPEGGETSVLLLTPHSIRRGELDPGEVETLAFGSEANPDLAFRD